MNTEQCEAVKGYIYRFEEAMKQAESVLVHGDLHRRMLCGLKGQ